MGLHVCSDVFTLRVLRAASSVVAYETSSHHRSRIQSPEITWNPDDHTRGQSIKNKVNSMFWGSLHVCDGTTCSIAFMEFTVQVLTDFLFGNRSGGLRGTDWRTPARTHVSLSAPSRYPADIKKIMFKQPYRHTEWRSLDSGPGDRNVTCANV